ncbi:MULTISPECIES: ATP-binding protein [unclassified Kaistella]|uniref:ATP-binding protein n=3 Tax=Kaistella TaxID=2782231 RepID=UPI002732C0A6|nr:MULTISPECIES: ATP-binding protein [unclassified Kaistella]MDP2455103.1 ATP-binding protein [Kaistella sp. SH11-4b]MDP2458010.1 ATP-binding protein [Kaistella sp. SH40-3]
MENQNTEYKESWRDEYIKWICGFANANGGKMYIGIDDKGTILGITDVKKLAEDLPNKVKDILGVLIDVNIKNDSDKEYLEIITDAYPYPVNYKGKYYYRSGATNQELKGAALDKFLLGKQGLKWDGTPEPYSKEADLSDFAFKLFKDRASETQRFDEDVQGDSPHELLEKLNLVDLNGYLKKAAVLLFHPKPEKIFTGATIKIGFFNTDDDLAYQDEVRGSLFEQVDKVMDLLVSKYLKAQITYEGLQRKETFPVPVGALREAVLNAIIHKDYSSGIPIQISVYDDKLIIWNEGELPENWTVAKLKIKHPSRPYNPEIANAFFRSGLIESWGRGTIKIFNEAKAAKIPVPIFRYEDNGFYVIFNFVEISIQQQVLDLIKEDPKMTVVKISELLSVNSRTILRTFKALQENSIIERLGNNRTGEWRIL